MVLGLTTVALDLTVGTPTHRNAESFHDAKINFRFAFDHWHDWALAVPRGDMKDPRVSEELKKMEATQRLLWSNKLRSEVINRTPRPFGSCVLKGDTCRGIAFL